MSWTSLPSAFQMPLSLPQRLPQYVLRPQGVIANTCLVGEQ